MNQIEVMRQALEYTRPGAIVPVTPETVKILVDALRLAIEQAERQEPMVVSQECAERGCMAHDDRVDGPGVVIERQWVGLTDEEIDKTYETQVWDARRSYARAIEAKLKEKNT